MTRGSLLRWHTLLLTAVGATPQCGGESTHTGTTGPDNDAGIPQQVTCENPVLLIGAETGFIQCDGGWMHREKQGVCPSSLPRPPSDTCDDLDCATLPNGHCDWVECPPAGGAQCFAGCRTDAECSDGMICLCGDPVGHCVESNCTTNADCGEGYFCKASVLGQAGPHNYSLKPNGFHCQTGADTCLGDVECTGSEAKCQWTGRHHACGGAICGRPFLVGGVARTAPLVRTVDWKDPMHVSQTELSASERDRLAQHYATMAQMEHASVAAFARFVLELLALAAPFELVEAAQAALGDELRHARACFSLTEAYSAAAMGAGPLALDGALVAPTLLGVAKCVIHEQCVGETIAAIEATEAARSATVPEVKKILTDISEDETRHALLGWRFLGWALEVATPSDRRSMLDELGAACEVPSIPRDGAPGIPSHGMLSASERALIREQVYGELLGPLAKALAAQTATGRSSSLSSDSTGASSMTTGAVS